MDTFFVLADTATRSTSSGDVAFSARPHAPVLPYVQPRHRWRRAIAAAQHLGRKQPAVRRPTEIACRGSSTALG
jgi:hypothetical protein